MINKYLKGIGNELALAGIIFNFIGDSIQIPLPNSFGTLEVIIWKDNEDSIQLLEGNFHTHGDIEAREYGLENREVAIRYIIESVFSGKFKMVKLKLADGSIAKTIWDEDSVERFAHGDDFEYHSET